MMFGTAWLTLKQIREALHAGQLEEASRLLAQNGVRGHKRTFELQQQVVNGFLERAERHLRAEAIASAWEDLRLAELLAAHDPAVERFRQKLLRLGMEEVRAALEAGRPGKAAEIIARLRDRGAKTQEVHPFDEAARNWLLSREAADAGEFVLALQNVDRVRKILPAPTTGLDDYRNQLIVRQESFQKAILTVHDALQGRRWREVVQSADAVLTVAPQSAEVRKARAEAWKAIEPESTLSGSPVLSSPGVVVPSKDSKAGDPRRLLLWIDGVGGYLICLTGRITLGQASGEAPVDVPLLADVSRMHATISRDNEGYLIEAARPVLVNGLAQTRAPLLPGDRVTLGASCQFLFQKPVPISASAKLEMVSGHRLPLSVSAVLLMADSLVLGPGTQTHVPIPDRKENIILFRHQDGIGIRCPGDFSIDGKRCKDRSVMGLQASAQGPDFALAIEPAGRI
jgi:hypothetical protein